MQYPDKLKDTLIEVCKAFDSASVTHWVIGGHGVELVVGQPIRPHEDIDFFVAVPHMTGAISALELLGFVHYAGSIKEGDVFYERGESVVDIVSIDNVSDPPLTTGDLRNVAWPKGLLKPQEVIFDGETFVTLTPEMHLEMKRIVAGFYGGEFREKDLLDCEVLRRWLELKGL